MYLEEAHAVNRCTPSTYSSSELNTFCIAIHLSKLSFFYLFFGPLVNLAARLMTKMSQMYTSISVVIS